MKNQSNPEIEIPNQSSWGTKEEFLLACAVNRHGLKDWDAVAMEIQKFLTTTAHHCEQKFLDLKRRFAAQCDGDAVAGEKSSDHVPWLDELRKLRVAELQQEVQRSDVSILSLQLKVKRLEEERGKSLNENDGEEEEEDKKPDLDDSGKRRSQNDEIGKPRKSPEPAATDQNGKNPTGDESDRENQSVNESNSTISVGKTGEGEVKLEPALVHEDGPTEPDAIERKATNPVGEESNNGSYDTEANIRKSESLPKNEERKVEESSELRDSVTHSRDGGGDGGTRESSEVQSSASLTRKRKSRRRKAEEDMPENDEAAVKSQPLIGVVELIKGHDCWSLFDRCLDSHVQGQESPERYIYKDIVRQHLNLETIQWRIRKGDYKPAICSFFRDLLLMCNNAIFFFPKDSQQAFAAAQLRGLINNELARLVPATQPDQLPGTTNLLPPNPLSTSSKPKPDSLLSKHNKASAAPILVCRKRSSISSKPSSSSASSGQKGDIPAKKPASDPKPLSSDTDEEPPKAKEMPVTRIRSLRRSSKSISANPSKKTGTAGKSPETSKSDQNRPERSAPVAVAEPSDKKRNAAANFLKRIKQNAPAEAARSGGDGSSRRSGTSGRDQKRVINNGRGDKGKERVTRHSGGGGSGEKKNENENSSESKKSVGRPPKKVAETGNTVSGKRGRESSAKDKRPKKRSRK